VSLEAALKCFVTRFHAQANTKKAKLLLETLESLVEANTIPARSESTCQKCLLKLLV